MLPLAILILVGIALVCLIERTDPAIRYHVLLDGMSPRDQRRARRNLKKRERAIAKSLRRLA